MLHAPDPLSLAARLDRLEAQNLQLRRALVVLAVLGAAAGLTGFATRGPTVVQAQRLELLSAAGERRAVLRADSGAFSLVLYGARNQPAAGLGLSEFQQRLVVFNGAGRVLASLGSAEAYPARP